MKKILLGLTSLCALSYSVQAQEPTLSNGFMETWSSANVQTGITTSVNYEFPENWTCVDKALGEVMLYTSTIGGVQSTPNRQIFKSTDAHEGTYAAKLVSRELLDTLGTTPAILMNANMDISPQGVLSYLSGAGDMSNIQSILNVSGGTPIMQKQVDSFIAYVKTPLTNNDAGIITITSLKIQQINGVDTLVPIGTGIFPIVTGDTSYRQVLIPMNYTDPSVTAGDTFRVMILSSQPNPSAADSTSRFGVSDSNTVFIDQMQIYTSVPDTATDDTTSINNIVTRDLGFNIYPNPSKNKVIYFKNNGTTQHAILNIYGINGRIMHQEVFNNELIKVDLQQYAPANYYYEITDSKSNARQVGQFIKP